MENYNEMIKVHYDNEAEFSKFSLDSTMRDLTTRNLEMKTLIKYINEYSNDNKIDCLEIGCGNCASSRKIYDSTNINLTVVDNNEKLLSYASENIKNTDIVVESCDIRVLNPEYLNKFDLIYTERCLINLIDINDQDKSIENIIKYLKPNGKILLLESYNDGLTNANITRSELGMDEIKPAYHNLLLNKDHVIQICKNNKTDFVKEDNFLSSYYFGSRILYPSLCNINNNEIKYNNLFSQFFAKMDPIGNFSPIKLLIFSKL